VGSAGGRAVWRKQSGAIDSGEEGKEEGDEEHLQEHHEKLNEE